MVKHPVISILSRARYIMLAQSWCSRFSFCSSKLNLRSFLLISHVSYGVILIRSWNEISFSLLPSHFTYTFSSFFNPLFRSESMAIIFWEIPGFSNACLRQPIIDNLVTSFVLSWPGALSHEFQWWMWVSTCHKHTSIRVVFGKSNFSARRLFGFNLHGLYGSVIGWTRPILPEFMQIFCASMAKIAENLFLDSMGFRIDCFRIIWFRHKLFHWRKIIVVARTWFLALFFLMRLSHNTAFPLILGKFNSLWCALLTFYLLFMLIEFANRSQIDTSWWIISSVSRARAVTLGVVPIKITELLNSA